MGLILEFYYFSAVEIKADRAIDFERLKNSNLFLILELK